MNPHNLPKQDGNRAGLAAVKAGLVATAEMSMGRVKAHAESRDATMRTPFRMSRLIEQANKDVSALEQFKALHPNV